ncbi:hypothetical protein PHJA_000741000 [Phtheirospermum japonicum]|uniref:Uncharacterized protein n=1 Tax=Phtheirospermum japonicum TaxID=374723 RepID=A0A830BV50_9LAMI|nr:hypothetical protein PHJA_000741000 [Phtheirospermum japonicum]
MQVLVTQASKAITQDAGRSWNHDDVQIAGGESTYRIESLTLGPAVLRSPTPSKGWKEPKGIIPTDFMLHKLEEVNKSVKKLEFLIENNQASVGPSVENV